MEKLDFIISDYRATNISSKKRIFLNRFLSMLMSGEIKTESVTTCICGSDDIQQLSKNERFGLPFGTSICYRCGLIFLNPRIQERSLPLFYEEVYWGLVLDVDQNTSFSTGGKDQALKIYDFISDVYEPKCNTLKIAEIGCGSGIKLKTLKDCFANNGIKSELYGVDYSSKALSQAQKRGINTSLGSLEAIKTQKPFDIIILSHVLEHFVDIKSALDAINSYMHQDSILYIEVPGVLDLENRKEYCYDYLLYSVLAHNYNFNLSSLETVAKMSDLELKKGSEYIRSVFKLSSGTAVQNVAKADNYHKVISSLQRSEKKRLKLTGSFSRQIRKRMKFLYCALFGERRSN